MSGSMLAGQPTAPAPKIHGWPRHRAPRPIKAAFEAPVQRGAGRPVSCWQLRLSSSTDVELSDCGSVSVEATHIEREHVVEAGLFGNPQRARDAARRSALRCTEQYASQVRLRADGIQARLLGRNHEWRPRGYLVASERNRRPEWPCDGLSPARPRDGTVLAATAEGVVRPRRSRIDPSLGPVGEFRAICWRRNLGFAPPALVRDADESFIANGALPTEL